jgi:hypothetical protein
MEGMIFSTVFFLIKILVILPFDEANLLKRDKVNLFKLSDKSMLEVIF